MSTPSPARRQRFFARRILFAALLAVLGWCPLNAAGDIAGIRESALLTPSVKPDGTLNLNHGVTGALDLTGWQVTLDSQHGPIFKRKGTAPQWVSNRLGDIRAAEAAGVPQQPLPFWLGLANGGLQGSVHALAVIGNDVYVGGIFQQTADGNVKQLGNIAKFNVNRNTWSALPNQGLGTAFGGVNALAVIGSDLYVGGIFDQSGDGLVPDLNNIAKFSNGAWSALPKKGLRGEGVYALAVSGNTLYAGGHFEGTYDLFVDQVISCNAIQFSGGAWSALPNKGLGGNCFGWVYALAVSGSDLYAGGFFGDTGDSTVTNLNHIAKLSDGKWSPLPNNGLNGDVHAIAAVGSDLYVGGDKTYGFNQTFDGVVKNLNRIARLRGGVWSALPGNGLNLIGPNGLENAGVAALTVSGTELYVGGFFSQTSDGAVQNLGSIAHFSTITNTWSAPPNKGLNGFGVAALAFKMNDLYVGGNFSETIDRAVTNLNNMARLTNDTDNDGLPDEWERDGVTIDGVFIDLPAMGADPLHKDLFVHADWMDRPGLKPEPRDLQIISDAFENAPMGNPDGVTGVRLHVDLGPESVMNPATGATWGALSKAGLQPYQATLGSLDAGRNYNWLATDTLKQMYFDPAKRSAVFHYVCFADSLGGLGSTSGISRGIPAHDFLVTLGGWRTFGGTSLQKAGTFMHELGHNLGLQHGGGDGVNFKPNFLSVMNYSFQILGLLRPSGIATVRDFDYSRSQLAALTETRLLESDGIGDAEGHFTLWNINQTNGACLEHPDDYYRLLAYPATDWSCDGALTPGTVSVDLNEDVTKTRLQGFDDWSALRFDGGGEIGRLVTSSAQRKLLPLSDAIATPADEPTYEDIRDFVPPSLFDAEASAPIDVATQTVATGSGPLSVNFDGRSSTTPGGIVIAWTWDFGDGTTGSDPTVAHTYAAPGTYLVTLRVRNSSGIENLVSLRHRVTVPVASGLPLVANISTRMRVETGDNVLIEGFIVQGPQGSIKKIMVRAIGPSLVPFGITDALANPTLEIHDSSGATVATNDDWKKTQVGGLITGDQSAAISASQLAPSDDLESAIIADLLPGSYTAVVRGFGNMTGTGVVDAYDLSAGSAARLANIATRGLIQSGDNLMIAGFIIQNGPVKAVVRAIGPSLTAFGINNALSDTTLQLRDQNGALVVEDDDWKIRSNGSSQQAEVEATGLQPSDDREAAFVTMLQPGQYTAQVRGKPEGTGIGVVQVYFLQ